MALANRISKKAFEALPDEIKEHYEADGNAHYKLDVTGAEDTGALQRAKARAEEEVADLKSELKEATSKVAALEAAGGPGAKDVDRLTRNFERKMATLKEEHEAALKGRDTFIEEQLIDGAANGLAKEISTVPTLMAEHVRKRMSVDFTGEKPKLVFKGKDGAIDPALKLEDVKKEILATPEYKPILTGNKAIGGAPARGALPATGATHAQVTDDKSKDLNSLDDKSFVERIRANRAAQGADQVSAEGAVQ